MQILRGQSVNYSYKCRKCLGIMLTLNVNAPTFLGKPARWRMLTVVPSKLVLFIVYSVVLFFVVNVIVN